MAVLEGYAEHVMDAVGGDVLDDLDSLRGALNRRRRERSGFLRLFERLIGMDLKLRQYEQGKRFCDAVVARGGIEALNRAWDSPEAMPTLAELDDPVGLAGAHGAPRPRCVTWRHTNSLFVFAVTPARALVYKQVFAGYVSCRADLELISLVRNEEGGLQMAETTNTTTKTTTTATKSTARKSTPRKTTARKSTSRGTTRSAATRSNTRTAGTRANTRTAAKAPSRSAAKGTRTRAKNQTTKAASANAQAAKVTAKQGRNVAERAALVYVGGVLEARDRVIGVATGIVDKYGSVPSAQKTLKRSQREIEKDVRRFERRGERETKLARTRVERLVRRNRRAFEREAGKVERKRRPSRQRRDGAPRGRLQGRGRGRHRRLEPRRGDRPGRRRHRRAHRDPRQGRHRVARSTFPRPPRRSGAPGTPAGLISRRWGSPASYPAGGRSTSPPSTVAVPFGGRRWFFNETARLPEWSPCPRESRSSRP